MGSVELSFFIALAPAEVLRTDIHIDQRSEAIHDEDGERHPLGIATEESDEDRQEPDECTVEELTAGAHGAGHVVRSHEDRPEHHTTREELEERCGVESGIDEVHDTAEDERCSEDRHGDVPSDDAAVEQEGEPEEQRQRTDFAEATSVDAEEQVRGRRYLIPAHARRASLYALGDAEGRGARDGVGIAEVLSSLGPQRHLCGIGDEEEDTTYECGVEDIPAEPAEAHLTDTDSDDGTDDDDPPGKTRGEVHPEEESCEDGRAVTDSGGLLVEVLRDDPFGEDAGEHAHGEHDEGAEAEGHQRDEARWCECDEHSVHVALDAVTAVDVGGRGYNEAIHRAGLAFACTDDGGYLLLAGADVVEQGAVGRAGVAARSALDTVDDVALLGSIPVGILDVAHKEGGVQPHGADGDALSAADTVAHGAAGGLLTWEDEDARRALGHRDLRGEKCLTHHGATTDDLTRVLG